MTELAPFQNVNICAYTLILTFLLIFEILNIAYKFEYTRNFAIIIQLTASPHRTPNNNYQYIFSTKQDLLTLFVNTCKQYSFSHGQNKKI